MLKAIFSVSFYTIISRILGFLRDMMQAAFLGVSPLMDAVAIALKVPSLFRKLFAEGAFNASFVPAFAGVYVKEGHEKAEEFAGQILALLLIVVTSVVILSELFMPHLIPLFAPGLRHDPERLHHTVAFARITFPFLLMISLTAFYSGILNSADRFVAAASSPAAGNVSIIFVLWMFGKTLQTPAHALIWGVLCCGFVQCGWVLWAAHHAGFTIRPIRPTLSPALRRFLRAFGPGVVGSGVAQINLFVDIALGSLLPAGGVSYLYYADRLNLLPLSVIGTAIATALLPTLSRHIQRHEHEKAHDSVMKVLKYGFLLCVPAAIGLFALAEPIIQVLFERQKFTHTATLETAKVLQAFVCGLPAYILIKIFTTVFFAHRDTKTPVWIGGAAILLNIGLSLLLMPYLAHVGLAISTAFTAWVNVGVLIAFVIHREWFYFQEFVQKILPKILASAAGLALFLWGIKEFFLISWIQVDHPWRSGLGLISVVVSGVLLFLGLTTLFKLTDLKDLKKKR